MTTRHNADSKSRTKKIWAVGSLSVTLVALVIAAALAWPEGNDRNEIKSPRLAAIESAVRTVVEDYNSGDWAALSNRACGDLAARIIAGQHDGVLTNRKGNGVQVTSLADFHYTTENPDGTGYTFAKVKLGVPGDSDGETSDQVAFFALLKNADSWNVCTSQLVTVAGVEG